MLRLNYMPGAGLCLAGLYIRIKRAMSEMDSLVSKLKELNLNLEFIKKTINRDECTESDKPKLEKSMEKATSLSAEIKSKFDDNRFPPSDKLKLQKLKSDFEKKMSDYSSMLEKYRDKKTRELRELRQTLSKRRTTMQQNDGGSSDEENGKGIQIEMVEVHQDTLFYERMIELKEKELLEIKHKMEEALQVQTEVGKLVREQGKQLDIIEDNVDSARSNVKEAGELLEEGVQHHKSANRKKMCIIGIVFVLLLVIIIPILIKVL